MTLRPNHMLLASLAWTLLVAAAAGISIGANYSSTLEQARVAARVAFEKDLTFRHWNSMHGGVYVPVTQQNPPNPYLDVPDRDLTTTNGRHLTLINPAYMSRQIYELQKYTALVQGHITSKQPLRPGNAPDAWEAEALDAFERGEREASSLEIIEGNPYMRIMRPLLVEHHCLKCHAKQGYKEGELRGGISVSVPMSGHLHEFHDQSRLILAGHGLIWVIGLFGILTGGRRLLRSIREERKAREDAEAANMAKGEFLANMSHEIRTPLNGVLGMLQLLKSEQLPNEQASYLTMAYDSGLRLLDLLNDILDFSRIEAGELALNPQPFCTRELLQSAASVFRASCAEHGLALHLHVEEDLPDMLVGDEARLRQILFNLLANAVKFTPSGHVSMEAWARPHGDGDGSVHFYLVISDTGIGIADDMLAKVFERFTQVEASLTRQYQGAGLGLAIVKRLVDLMGGSISVHSEQGKGSTFHLQVLLRLPEGQDAQTPCLIAQQQPQQPDTPLHVLLVEDEEVSRLSSQVLLARLGCQVKSAENGLAAVRLFALERFDCVFMDIQMPEMDGVEATRAMRGLEAKDPARTRTRIIALTAYAMPGDRERFLAEGMDDYLTKPVQSEDLRQALSRALRA